MRRGKINHRERAKQINDFTGLQYGTITPTDIDGLIEYQDKAYVFIELKHADVELPYGQRLALERLTDDLEKTGKPSICIVASHQVDDPKKDVKVAETLVKQYYWNGKWKTAKSSLNPRKTTS